MARLLPRSLMSGTLAAVLAVVVAGTASASAVTTTAAGTLRGPDHRGLPGMRIEAVPATASACTTASGCVSTYSVAGGRFMLGNLAAGRYDIEVVDGLQTVEAKVLKVGATGGTVTLGLTLGPPAVPAGTRAQRAGRALRWLQAERRRAGVPADVELNARWSQECAAHDGYELANDTLQSAENPAASGYSLGGAWAGLGADLAAGRWSATGSPWQDAPVNLLALLAPSLSVTGIDDSPTRQCAVTFPGMLRTPPSRDTIHTVPADGARGVATSELARESPYTPVQFVGLPATRTTGDELFVYLNRVGMLGQAPVHVAAATLSHDGHRVALRWVDDRTRVLGPDLAGAILIPVGRLRPHATYHATVSVDDGARVLRRAWSFTTA